MAWSAEDRRRYAPAIQDMVRGGMIARLAQTIDAIDPQPKLGRQRVWSATIMLQALWQLARDGCAWRRLPSLFPPWTTVWSRLRRWRELAVLDRALVVVVACCRLAKGRKRRPTAASVDTQSVRTGPQRGPRGYDADKKMKGRKRVLMIDTQGHPLGVRAVPADVHGHRALLTLAPDRAAHPTLLLIWLDRGFAGDDPEAFLNGHGITADVRRDQAPQGLSARAEAVEGRANLRHPPTLLTASGRRRNELRDLARHDRPRCPAYDRHAPRTQPPRIKGLSFRLLVAVIPSGRMSAKHLAYIVTQAQIRFARFLVRSLQQQCPETIIATYHMSYRKTPRLQPGITTHLYSKISITLKALKSSPKGPNINRHSTTCLRM